MPTEHLKRLRNKFHSALVHRRAAFDWRAPIATLPLGTCSRDQPVPNPGVGALNAVATSPQKWTAGGGRGRPA
jgi:hypothetical protein